MSEPEQTTGFNESIEAVRDQYADAFDLEKDPLAAHSDPFSDLPDPFEYFIQSVLIPRNSITSESTMTDYRRSYKQWRGHMSTVDRHPACPNVVHVRSFIDWCRDVRGNSRRTIQQKINHLSQALEHWQNESVFPHSENYNPFELGKETADFGNGSKKEFPALSLNELQVAFAELTNIQYRGIVGYQLKTGARSGELRNLRIEDIEISHVDLKKCYPDLGSHPALEGYTDVVVIPPDRDGNKSKNPRLIPIDDELRWLLLRHLLSRPQVDEPWVFLSERTFTQITHDGVNKAWKTAFHPEYCESEETRGITSHYGRHWFSSFWRLEANLEREHVQYMRGDRIEPLDDFRDAIDDYLHPRYDLIESVYRNKVFKLDLPMQHYVGE